MRKSLRTFLNRSIVVLLLLTFLTFTVGKVKKVEAVATTGAIIGSALVATGAIYLSYLALTGANVSIPSGTGADIQEYLHQIGQKVSYYTSGGAIYQTIYRALRGDAAAQLNNIDYTLTREDLINTYNDFKDISLNQGIQSYSVDYDVPLPAAPFDYEFSLASYPTDRVSYGGSYYTLEYIYQNYDVIDTYGTRFVFNNFLQVIGNDVVGYPFRTSLNYEFRNVLQADGYYRLQYLNNGVWSDFTGRLTIASLVYQSNAFVGYLYPYGIGSNAQYRLYSSDNSPSVAGTYVYPIAIDSPIYIESTGETVEIIPVESTEIIKSPQYPDNNDNDGKIIPVVPYVQLPSDNNWGFNVGDLVQTIIDRAGQIITATAIGDLINAFKNGLLGTSQDQYYSYYNEGDTYNIDYYYNTYTGDYTVYNIDVSEQEDIIPVDLNTISQYTENDYLTVLKERATAAGNTFAEYVAFWHNCDPEIVYVLLGSGILILLGAFIGKWGHS